MKEALEIGPLLVEVSLVRRAAESEVTLSAWHSGDFVGQWELTFEKDTEMRPATTERYGPYTETTE